MARLAWFSPMPPVRSGVAACNAELVEALRGDHTIDVFVGAPAAPRDRRVRSAHDFVWLQRQAPYDLTVFQLGNSAHHEFVWPYVFRYPGLTVLHDVHLHHARAAALLRANRSTDYRVEFARNHPDVSPDLAELAVAGFDTHQYYSWPMIRLVAEASRLVAVHNRMLADQVRAEVPGAAVETVTLGHGRAVSLSDLARWRRLVRERHQIPHDCVLFGCYGGLTPEKRIPEVLEAFASTRRQHASIHLLLAGEPPDHLDVPSLITRWDLADAVTMTGYLETEDELTACIAATDVGVTLRWPTAREISGPWLRALAAGKPTITIDLQHLVEVPSLDPRTWQPNPTARPGGSSAASDLHSGEPVCVAVDILDERHSLTLAMRRLARDQALRETLGNAARRYWNATHTIDRMRADYLRVIPLAAARPVPAPHLPEHVLDAGDQHLRRLLEPFGVPSPLR